MPQALVVIDVQNALCSGEYKTFDADNVISRINQVASKARQRGIPVIFVQHEAEDESFQKGSRGWQLAEGLEFLSSDIFVGKRATDSFHNTGLQSILNSLAVDRLTVCGMQSDFCVDTTIRRALALGYPVDLISDGHTTVDNSVLSARQISEHHNVTLSNIESFGPRVRLVTAANVTFQDS